MSGSYATLSGCNPAQTTYFVAAGTVDTNASDLYLFDVFQTTTTTDTILHTQVYELNGLAATTVPEANSSALLFLSLSAIGSRVREDRAASDGNLRQAPLAQFIHRHGKNNHSADNHLLYIV